MQRLRTLEARVAQQVGVSMLYSASQLQAQPHYTHFLERLAAEAASRGPLRWARPPASSLLSSQSVEEQP